MKRLEQDPISRKTDLILAIGKKNSGMTEKQYRLRDAQLKNLEGRIYLAGVRDPGHPPEIRKETGVELHLIPKGMISEEIEKIPEKRVRATMEKKGADSLLSIQPADTPHTWIERKETIYTLDLNVSHIGSEG